MAEMGRRCGDRSATEQSIKVFESSGAKVFLAFALHDRAHLLAREAADATQVVQAYDAAIAALDAVNAHGEHAAACQARNTLLQ